MQISVGLAKRSPFPLISTPTFTPAPHHQGICIHKHFQVSTPQHRLGSPAPPSGAISDGNRPASVVAVAVPRLNGKIFHQARSQAKDKDYR
ncbi:hypothetical protein IKG12_00225 [Candidatus Saccharibacteria bacterium]|nr:hypothetical protein [Candidatus Saccharibacteria bacterium]